MMPWTLLSPTTLKVALVLAVAAACVAAGATLAGLYWKAKYTTLEKSIVVERSQAREDAHEMYRLNNRMAAAASQNYQAKKEKANVVYRDVVKVVTEYIDRPVYRNECIDDDGLRALGRAIDAANANRPAPR